MSNEIKTIISINLELDEKEGVTQLWGINNKEDKIYLVNSLTSLNLEEINLFINRIIEKDNNTYILINSEDPSEIYDYFYLLYKNVIAFNFKDNINLKIQKNIELFKGGRIIIKGCYERGHLSLERELSEFPENINLPYHLIACSMALHFYVHLPSTKIYYIDTNPHRASTSNSGLICPSVESIVKSQNLQDHSIYRNLFNDDSR